MRWPKYVSSTTGAFHSRAEEIPTTASLFARIPGDWKYDWTAFRDACRKSRWEGPPKLRIERA